MLNQGLFLLDNYYFSTLFVLTTIEKLPYGKGKV